MKHNEEWDALQTAIETLATTLIAKGEDEQWVRNVCHSTVDHTFDQQTWLK